MIQFPIRRKRSKKITSRMRKKENKTEWERAKVVQEYYKAIK